MFIFLTVYWSIWTSIGTFRFEWTRTTFTSTADDIDASTAHVDSLLKSVSIPVDVESTWWRHVSHDRAISHTCALPLVCIGFPLQCIAMVSSISRRVWRHTVNRMTERWKLGWTHSQIWWWTRGQRCAEKWRHLEMLTMSTGKSKSAYHTTQTSKFNNF